MGEYESALALVSQHPDEADFEEPQDPALVAAAADALGLAVPPTYKRFLLELGVGDFAGEEFYGVISPEWTPVVPDGIGVTLEYRATMGLPAAYIIVGDTGTGGFYVLDTEDTDEDGEAPVLVWIPGVPSEDAGRPERVADSFGAFFLNRVHDALAG